jgi:hypothetical protein
VSISSVEDLRQKRHSEGKFPVQFRDVTDDVAASGQGTDENLALVRELVARLEDVQYELGRVEARLELTAYAESALQEALERERERADRLEAELQVFRQPQIAQPQDTPGMASEGIAEEGGVPRELQEGLPQRSWLYRFFFGPS